MDKKIKISGWNCFALGLEIGVAGTFPLLFHFYNHLSYTNLRFSLRVRIFLDPEERKSWSQGIRIHRLSLDRIIHPVTKILEEKLYNFVISIFNRSITCPAT